MSFCGPKVRLATWDEIDTAGAVWTVPAARMKAKREHRVPLCGRALEVLDAARTLGDGGGLVFPMRSGTSLASSTFPKMLQYHEVAAVPNGDRTPIRGRRCSRRPSALAASGCANRGLRR